MYVDLKALCLKSLLYRYSKKCMNAFMLINLPMFDWQGTAMPVSMLPHISSSTLLA